MADCLQMDEGNNAKVAARRLMAMLSQSMAGEQGREIMFGSSGSGSDLESVAAEVLGLLCAESASLSIAEAIVFAANSGPTLLHLSASLGFKRLVKELIGHGVDPNQRDVNGFTPLLFAALFGHIDCVKLLVFEDANLGITDIWGRTARDVALGSNHYDIAEFLEAREVIIAKIDKLINEQSDNKDHKPLPGAVEPDFHSSGFHVFAKFKESITSM